MIDWRARIESMLIAGGTDGVPQGKIIMAMAHIAESEPIVEYLENLLDEDKVQRFVVRTKGRPLTIWRATTKILAFEAPEGAVAVKPKRGARNSKANGSA